MIAAHAFRPGEVAVAAGAALVAQLAVVALFLLPPPAPVTVSISDDFAVTMMIGTDDRLRISRHTSTPDTPGSITSRRMRSGSTSSNRLRASGPVRATSTVKPSRRSPTLSASM